MQNHNTGTKANNLGEPGADASCLSKGGGRDSYPRTTTPAGVPSNLPRRQSCAGTAGGLFIGLFLLAAGIILSGCEPYVAFTGKAGYEGGKTNDTTAIDANVDGTFKADIPEPKL